MTTIEFKLQNNNGYTVFVEDILKHFPKIKLKTAVERYSEIISEKEDSTVTKITGHVY